MKITGNETLSSLIDTFSKASDSKHLRLTKNGEEKTLKVHDGIKLSGWGPVASQKRADKHKEAVSFVREVLEKNFPNDMGKIDNLMSNIGSKKISVKQLKQLQRELDPESVTGGKSGSSKEVKGSKVGNNRGEQPSLPDELDFSNTKGHKVHDSGHGGVVSLEAGGMRVAIKGHAKGPEVLGSRLARELGLASPKTRFLTPNESHQLSEKGIKGAKNSTPEVVMQFVSGTAFENAGSIFAKNPKNTAIQIGQWLAFDCFISEGDRFHGFGLSESTGPGLNHTNFLVGKDGTIVGIDQNVGTGKKDGKEGIEKLTSGDEFNYVGMGYMLAEFIPDSDGEVLAGFIKEGAEQMFKKIGQDLTPDKLDDLAVNQKMTTEQMNKLKVRLQSAIDFANR